MIERYDADLDSAGIFLASDLCEWVSYEDHERVIKELQSRLESLENALKKANDQAEHFEREWYLRGDLIESLEKDAARYRWLRDASTDVALVIDKRTNYTPPSDDGMTGGYWDYEYRCGEDLDSSIDEAMKG